MRVDDPSLKNRWMLVGVSFGAAILILLVGISVYVSVSREDSSGLDAANISAPIRFFPRISDLGMTLKEASTPAVITILGDSTGNERIEWVYLLAEYVADNYGRVVTVHDWSDEDKKYVGEHKIGTGGNAAVTIWNGSASGADAAYSIANFASLAPEVPDVVLMNHGHNYTTANAASQGQGNLLNLIRQAWPESKPALAVTLQNPRLDKSDVSQSLKVAALRASFARRADVAVIDVWSKFLEGPSLPTLLRPDGFNPNESGQEMWVHAVEDALGLEDQ